ncbi:hypothetical protein GWK48_09970 [Metallosphaera tengchongensis]|uniref:Uncharacterized protein n=1 Tax=Metallosphaera tengchongensis TaxID=1532350 RepID=A0A6N0NZ75_9CREN|nr:hypothetical protein [Metallosphaera tengchongensis]QKR00668.1 hypothetical protein GWK48_09970 [Metallosphaera tengchongensis]
MAHYAPYTLKPGMTPWQIVLGYFIAAGVVAVILLVRKRDKLTALDLVYSAIGGALVAVADHVVGDLIFLPSPIFPIVNPPVWFRILAFFLTIGLVRKVGSGMFTMAVFDLVGDLLHFDFAGEPLWLVEDVLTYGLFADLTIFLTRNKIFGIGSSRFNFLLAVAEGALLGFVFSFVHPFFTYGFIAPFVFGFAPNDARVIYLLLTYIPGDIVIGVVSAILANRVSRVVL